MFKRSFNYVMLAFGVFTLLAAYFILPNVFYGAYSLAAESGADPRLMSGGYGTGFAETLLAMTGIALPEVSLSALSLDNLFVSLVVVFVETVAHLVLALVYPFTARVDLSWEYSIYIGPVGALLMLAGWYGFFRGEGAPGRSLRSSYWREIVVFAGVTVLALSVTSGLVWMVLHKYLGINAIDRLPTRLILYPLFVGMLCASVGLDRLRNGGGRWMLDRVWVQAAIVLTLAGSLLWHASRWSFRSTSVISGVVEIAARQKKPVFHTSIVEVTDSAYWAAVNVGFTLSFLTALAVVGAMVLLRRRSERSEA